PPAVDQALVRKRRLRILVQVFHVRVGGRGIQIEVVFLDVLAVVALIAGQSEEPLLENRIAAIPQRDGEADVLVAVANAGDAVLAPAVRSGAGVVVREILPGGPVRAVIFAHRAPLPFADVGSPLLPVGVAPVGFVEAGLFGAHDTQVTILHASGWGRRFRLPGDCFTRSDTWGLALW